MLLGRAEIAGCRRGIALSREWRPPMLYHVALAPRSVMRLSSAAGSGGPESTRPPEEPDDDGSNPMNKNKSKKFLKMEKRKAKFVEARKKPGAKARARKASLAAALDAKILESAAAGTDDGVLSRAGGEAVEGSELTSSMKLPDGFFDNIGEESKRLIKGSASGIYDPEIPENWQDMLAEARASYPLKDGPRRSKAMKRIRMKQYVINKQLKKRKWERMNAHFRKMAARAKRAEDAKGFKWRGVIRVAAVGD